MSNNGDTGSSWSHDETGDYKEYGQRTYAGNGRKAHMSRREQSENVTGALPALGSSLPIEYAHTESPEFEYLLQSLHDLFEHDRQVASQPDSTRCGLCYLYYPVSDLHYRDEGFYVCPACETALGNHRLPMLHRQQKM